jgi:hypothetical protein
MNIVLDFEVQLNKTICQDSKQLYSQIYILDDKKIGQISLSLIDPIGCIRSCGQYRLMVELNFNHRQCICSKNLGKMAYVK